MPGMPCPHTTEVSLPNVLLGGLTGACTLRQEGSKTREPLVSACPAGSLNGEGWAERVNIDLTAESVLRLLDTHLPESILQMPFAFYKQETAAQEAKPPTLQPRASYRQV